MRRRGSAIRYWRAKWGAWNPYPRSRSTRQRTSRKLILDGSESVSCPLSVGHDVVEVEGSERPRMRWWRRRRWRNEGGGG